MLLAGALIWWLGPEPVEAPRNVVMISLDTLRADHLGLYGYQRPTSPALDALAEDSVVFDDAVAPAPNTAPSQMSLMTSLYPREHGFLGTEARLPADRPMLAELLERAGYRTAGFTDGGYLSSDFGFGRGFEHFEDERGGFGRILPRAADWVARNRDRPFFLFLHTYDIHTPYLPPKAYRGLFHDEPYRGAFVPTTQVMNAAAYRGRVLTDDERRHAVDSYDEGIRYVDDRLASFLTFLRVSGVLDESLLIVLSDHGEEFGEHGSYLHWKLFYQPNLRVPLLIRLPGALGGGERVAQRVETVDVLPTILDLLGLPPLERAQGRSLVPLLLRAARPWHARLGRLPEVEEPRPALAWPPAPDRLPGVSVIHGRHQAIFHPHTGDARLFDLEKDPMALRDVADDHPEVVAQLREAWLGWRAEHGSAGGGVPPAADDAPLDDETLRQLEALGYLEPGTGAAR